MIVQCNSKQQKYLTDLTSAMENKLALYSINKIFKQLYTKLDIITVELKPSLLLNVSLLDHLITVLLVLLSSLNLCF